MRTWPRRMLLGTLALAAVAVLYLLGANLFLGTGLGSRLLSRNSDRFHIGWSRAWSLWPGEVRVRGLKLGGDTGRVEWSIAVAKADGHLTLVDLLRRRVTVDRLTGEGVVSHTRRHPQTAAGALRARRARQTRAAARRRPFGRREPWSLYFSGVALEHVREVAYDGFRLTGDGPASGGFSVVLGGPFAVAPSRLEMPSATLSREGWPLAGELRVKAAARIAPYSRRRYPGFAGFDFVSGKLSAVGKLATRSAPRQGGPDRLGPPAGPVAIELALADGRLLPGTRVTIGSGRAAPETAPLVATAAVTAGGASNVLALPMGPGAAAGPSRSPHLDLAVESSGLALGGGPGRPPTISAAAARLTARTPELRLSRLLTRASAMRRGDPGPGSLAGDLAVEGFLLDTASGRVVTRLALERAHARIDVASLLDHRVELAGLAGDGLSLRLNLRPLPPPVANPPVPWTIEVAGASLGGVHELGLGHFTLSSGGGRLEGGFHYRGGGTLRVERALLAIPAGEFRAGGETVARHVDLRAEARLAPFVPGNLPGLRSLRVVSGTLAITSEVSSLGFLDRYLASIPGLTIEGSGKLAAAIELAQGRLLPGSRFDLRSGRVEGSFLNSRAVGLARVSGTVVADPRPMARLRVDFDRFMVAAKSGPPFLRGRGLKLAAQSTDLDLATPVTDLAATIDLAAGEVPNLAAYNTLLPDGAGTAILGGRGRLGLKMALDGVRHGAKGEITLASDDLAARFQDLEIDGRLSLRALLASKDLAAGQFDLAGSRLDLEGVTYRPLQAESGANPAESPAAAPWWLRASLSDGSLRWAAPLTLAGSARVAMKDSGLLLELFAQKRRFLAWFGKVLDVGPLEARGDVRMGDGEVAVDRVRVAGGPLELRTRMRFAKGSKAGDLLIRYGRLATAIELRDGRRDFKLVHPTEWYEGKTGFQ